MSNWRLQGGEGGEIEKEVEDYLGPLGKVKITLEVNTNIEDCFEQLRRSWLYKLQGEKLASRVMGKNCRNSFTTSFCYSSFFIFYETIGK